MSFRLQTYIEEGKFKGIAIGATPRVAEGEDIDFLKTFDVFINVSDSPSWDYPFEGGIRHWYPINELSVWPYGAFFWFKRTIDHYLAQGKRIFIHCHGGVCRSPCMFVAWAMSHGLALEEACSLADLWPEKYLQHIADGQIPSNIPELWKRMEAHPTYALMDLVTRNAKGDVERLALTTEVALPKTLAKHGASIDLG